MLDVHPPHEAAHTWKDFLIHIATIVIGLLIAVGLEQTVEAIHRHNERTELRAGLLDEMQFNDHFAAMDIEMTERVFDWTQKQIAAVDQAGASGALLMQRMPSATLLFPDTGVWFSAKDNGSVALLSTSEQVWYTDLYRVEARSFAQSTGAYDQFTATIASLDTLLVNLPAGPGSKPLDLSSFSPAQRTALLEHLQRLVEAARGLDRELVYFQTINRFMLDTPRGAWDRESATGSSTGDTYLNTREKNIESHPASRFTLNER